MRSVLQAVVAHLAATLDVPVAPVAPKERPDAFVIVDPVGGRSELDALHPDYAIQAWTKSYADSEQLCRACCDAMREMGATPYADPVPLGYDGTYYWWQATYTVHALW
jgi:hypothetical protein